MTRSFGVWLGCWTRDRALVLGVRDGYRPYFENYTVDASILDNAAVFIHSSCCHIQLVIVVIDQFQRDLMVLGLWV